MHERWLVREETNPISGPLEGGGLERNGGVACRLQVDPRLDQSEGGNPRQSKRVSG